jgi:mRNA-degrading endonuclease YafQ of YafQ-DinJ toxin-antitoxin module
VTSLVWSSAFARALKQKIRRNPELRDRIEQTLRQLAEDPFQPSLRSHKLKGALADTWACSAAYDLRILFEFVQNPQSAEEEILLLAIGTHDEVY